MIQQYGDITKISIILNKSIQLGINKDKFIQDIKKLSRNNWKGRINLSNTFINRIIQVYFYKK
jgi:hypothetical protein